MNKKIKEYQRIYIPENPQADKTGMAYTHRIKASEYLGRQIKPEEYVHHEDKNPQNNLKENLFVFKSNADHMRYHMTGIKKQIADGTWISPKKDIFCNYCNKKIDAIKRKYSNYCSKSCATASSRMI